MLGRPLREVELLGRARLLAAARHRADVQRAPGEPADNLSAGAAAARGEGLGHSGALGRCRGGAGGGALVFHASSNIPCAFFLRRSVPTISAPSAIGSAIPSPPGRLPRASVVRRAPPFGLHAG